MILLQKNTIVQIPSTDILQNERFYSKYRQSKAGDWVADSEIAGRRRNVYIFPVVIIVLVSAIVVAPPTAEWVNSRLNPVHQGIIIIKGKSSDWHTGILLVEYSDGIEESWTIDGYWDMSYLHEDHPLYGYVSYAQPSRNFTQTETCRVTYVCIGLNMTIGPITVHSDVPQIIYPADVSESMYTIWWIVSYPE